MGKRWWGCVGGDLKDVRRGRSGQRRGGRRRDKRGGGEDEEEKEEMLKKTLREEQSLLDLRATKTPVSLNRGRAERD